SVIVTSQSQLLRRWNTAGSSPDRASVLLCAIAVYRSRRSTLLHSICMLGSPITSAAPVLPQYCTPRRHSYPHSRSLAASSRSPLLPFSLLALPISFTPFSPPERGRIFV